MRRDCMDSHSSGSESPQRIVREPTRVFGSSLEMEALERMDSSRLLRLPSYREVDRARIESPEQDSFLPLSPIAADKLPYAEDDGMVSTAASAARTSTTDGKAANLDAVRRSYDHQIAKLVENWQRDVRRADQLQAELVQEKLERRQRRGLRLDSASTSPVKLRNRGSPRDKENRDTRRGRGESQERPRKERARADWPREPTPERRTARRAGYGAPRAKSCDKRSPRKRHAARPELQGRKLMELGQGFLALRDENEALRVQLLAERELRRERGDQRSEWPSIVVCAGLFLIFVLLSLVM